MCCLHGNTAAACYNSASPRPVRSALSVDRTTTFAMHMNRVTSFFLVVLLTGGNIAFAQEGTTLNNLNLLGQKDFSDMSHDLGAAVAYRRLAPAQSLGSTGFDMGFGISSTRLEHQSAFDQATSEDSPDILLIPKLYFQKGLPYGFDVGAYYTAVPDSNMELVGGGVSYSLLPDHSFAPAISIQGTFSRLIGVDDLSLDTRGLDLSISKGFSLLTPYVGVGRVWVNSDPARSTGLLEEEFSQDHYYIGANMNIGLFRMALEGDTIGDTSTYNFKLGVRF